jgi:hypothetical protein
MAASPATQAEPKWPRSNGMNFLPGTPVAGVLLFALPVTLAMARPQVKSRDSGEG